VVEEKPKSPGIPDPVPPAYVMAAKKGCAQCCGRLRIPPAGPPFSGGPNVGRYLCADCWTLYYTEHTEHLADEDTKKFIAEEARKIFLRRQASVLYEDGPNKVYMSARGTMVFETHMDGNLAPLEFDARKLAWFMKAIAALQAKIPAAGIEVLLK